MTLSALVTGGGAGLGKALVEGLIDKGYRVIAVDRDATALSALPAPVIGIVADLGEIATLDRLVADLDAPAGFDVVVMDAGISASGPFEDIDPARQSETIAVNLVAPIALTALLARRNMLAKGSTLVFISSLSYRVGYPGAAVYAATKDGIAIFAKSLRRPFRRRNVGILTVLPGPMDTEHARRYAPPGSSGKGRMAPKRVADAIINRIGRPGVLIPGAGPRFLGAAGVLFPAQVNRLTRKLLFERLRP